MESQASPTLPKALGRDYNVITMATTARIIRIGNSRGIRVPKALLEQSQLPDEVELLAEPGRLTVRPLRRNRAGWADAARSMRMHGDDRLLDVPGSTRFDEGEWEWR
jgi:antitoxin MazE